MLPSFLPFAHATFIFDFIFLALVLLVPLLHYSVHLARSRRYEAHKRVQIGLTLVLLVTVLAFELEVRTNGWLHLTTGSTYAETWLMPVLYVHLAFAISTFFLWTATLWGALRKMPVPPRPCAYSPKHKRLGKLAVLAFDGTAITGWIFYWIAFVA